MPIISVIVPIYNSRIHLHTCIQSIIAQTFSDIEIILVNDGSTDNSGEICNQFAEQDPRIIVIHKENGGVSSARHAGLAIARGKYIGFVDNDDWLELDMYEFLHNLIIEHDADIACCAMKVVQVGIQVAPPPADGKIFIYNKDEAVRAILTDKEVQSYVMDKLFKRELFEGFISPDDPYHQDYASTFLLFDKANKVVIKRDGKYVYNFHGNNVSANANLTPKLLYNSFLAHLLRQEYIDAHCDDLVEMNLGRTLTAALRAVHAMIRLNEHVSKNREGFDHIHEWLKKSMYRMRRNTTISRRLIYFARWFVAHKSSYVAMYKLGIQNTLEKCINVVRS